MSDWNRALEIEVMKRERHSGVVWCRRCGKPVKPIRSKYCGSCRRAIRKERADAKRIRKAMKQK